MASRSARFPVSEEFTGICLTDDKAPPYPTQGGYKSEKWAKPSRYRVRPRGKMTEVFRCLALLCAVSVVHSFMDVRDDASWFKNGERFKNKFVTGVVNGVVDTDCTDSLGSETIQGECMSKFDCLQSGGRPGGLCSLMGSCCYVRKTCGDTTSSKVSYFVSPANWTSSCQLTVTKYSKAVCQIRLDFEKFDIAPPTQDSAATMEAYKCHDDKFRVEEYFKRFKMPPLCGKNDGQHIYIHVGKPEEKIDVIFDLKQRIGESENLGMFSWKIKITQLECGKRSCDNFLNAPSKLMQLHSTLKNKKKSHNEYDLIAPPGCFQYYKEDTGTFESFNYNGGKGPYIGNLHYAVCLRKSYNITGAEYEFPTFQLSHNMLMPCHGNDEADENNSQDYIRIPEGWYKNGNRAKIFQDHYCNSHGSKVTATANEPLYVGVHTDGFKKTNIDESGFRIKYKLLTESE